MDPLYSVILCNQEYSDYKDKVQKWLFMGIKVIWFSQIKDEGDMLKTEYKPYTKALFLQTYVVDFQDKAYIIDGDDKYDFVRNVLEIKCPLFNSAQYLVEHCKADEHIIVQASAGTGKTTVMIDRILFLIHTDPSIHMSEIFMITFTNDATNQMNKRLQEALLTRYELTHDEKYLRWLEDQSQMNISTIHSFAYLMLKEYGIGEGFTRNLSIRSFKYEKNEIIKDAVDGKLDDSQSIIGQLGMPFYRANGVLNQFWSRFLQLGISHSDILDMDWGEADNKASEAFHKILKEMIPKLDESYFEIKRRNDGVGLDDIMRDLQAVLDSEYLPNPDISMKYLFIDEFQDSDLSQIMVACTLVKLLKAILFVVGDVKQSIYRFRGANDQSFTVLNKYMQQMNIKSAVDIELVNNYRTSANVIQKMDKYFRIWGKEGLLKYEKPVIPFNQENGICKMIYFDAGSDNKSDELEKKVASIASERLEDLIQRVDNGGIIPTDKTRVVMLARTHWELNMGASTLRKYKIPVYVKEDGSFYASEAVRDFYIMISSFMFPDEPKYIFDFLLTPYAGDVEPMDVNSMEMLHGNYENLVGYLDHFLNQTRWKSYYRDLRIKPVLSVLKEILDDVSVVDNFIVNRKKILKDQGWEEGRCNAQTFTDAKQYQANLEKLMDIIQRNFGGEKLSIYDIYNFLKLNIATNRDENEADTQSEDDYRSVLCMTVHKAKGLEFDTIFIPYTNRVFLIMVDNEVIVDPISKKVGWNYIGVKGRNKDQQMNNNYYKKMKTEDAFAVIQEETRILYVAMTRAINNFICLVPQSKREETWAYLLEEGGVDYE